MAIEREWLSSANGYLKLTALIISIVCLILFFMYGGSYTYVLDDYDDDLYYFDKGDETARMATIVLPANIFVLFYLMFSYTFDDNYGNIIKTEIIFTGTQVVFNFVLAVMSVYFSLVQENETLIQNLCFAMLVFLVGVILFVDTIFSVRRIT